MFTEIRLRPSLAWHRNCQGDEYAEKTAWWDGRVFSSRALERCPAGVATLPGTAPACRRRADGCTMSTPLDESGDERSTDVVVDVTATPEREFGEVVLYAIADELGADPTALPPIAESIDPDVLNEFSTRTARRRRRSPSSTWGTTSS